jgi:HlyD family secretion protein
MQHGPPPILRVVIVLVLLSLAAYWFFFLRQAEADGRLAASGTIEAYQVNVSAETGGRVLEVGAAAGETVTAGQPLVRFDTTLLEAQLLQTQAVLAAAQANYDLLAAGPSTAQRAAAEAGVARAQAALDAANEQLDAAEEQADSTAGQIEELTQQIAETTATVNAPPASPPSAEQQAALAQAQQALAGLNAQLALAQQAQAAANAQANLLASQVTVAEATLDSAEAQLAALQEGARPEQLAAAEAQVAAARAAVNLVETQIGRQTLLAPIDGVVLTRAVEPGEVAAPGAALLIVGRLDELTMTVYVPEDRYGRIHLGQAAAITVDAFPGQTFTGAVQRIAEQAEFTPRNVQTAEGRASTVFAIELALTNQDGQLKPGMPADVDFEGD